MGHLLASRQKREPGASIVAAYYMVVATLHHTRPHISAPYVWHKYGAKEGNITHSLVLFRELFINTDVAQACNIQLNVSTSGGVWAGEQLLQGLLA